MKVLYLHHGIILGGAPLSLLFLAREIECQPGMQIELACHSDTMRKFFSHNLKSPVHEWPDPLTFIGRYLIGYVPLASVQARRLFFEELRRVPYSIWKQYRGIRKMKPDIVHLNSSVMFTSALAVRLARAALVWHVREPLQGARWKQKLSSFVIRHLAHEVIAISEVEAKRFPNCDKIKVVYNPLNFESLREELYNPIAERKKLGLNAENKVIVTLGGVAPRKGALEQIQAMEYTDDLTRLVIAGPPLPANSKNEYHQQLYQALAKLLPNKVIFTGILENVAPLLAASDVLTFTGMTPHFPRPVFEAWLMKKPVIVFDMEGVSNQVTHGVNGIVVKELTGRALGMAIVELLANPAAIKKMCETGMQKAGEKCKPAFVAERVLSIYQEVLG